MNRIEFSGKFDAIICLNADLPEKDFFDRFQIPVLASDGAGILLYRKGVFADKVIGDLDSFYSEPENVYFAKERIIEMPGQDANDFEKCLRYVINCQYYNILIVGFNGGQLEHTLNNWSVFAKYSKELNLCIYDKGRYGFSANKGFRISLQKNEIVSLIPQHNVRLETKGLKWELADEDLVFGQREGARNLALEENVLIDIKSGEMIVFVDDRLPDSPIRITENIF